MKVRKVLLFLVVGLSVYVAPSAARVLSPDSVRRLKAAGVSPRGGHRGSPCRTEVAGFFVPSHAPFANVVKSSVENKMVTGVKRLRDRVESVTSEGTSAGAGVTASAEAGSPASVAPHCDSAHSAAKRYAGASSSSVSPDVLSRYSSGAGASPGEEASLCTLISGSVVTNFLKFINEEVDKGMKNARGSSRTVASDGTMKLFQFFLDAFFEKFFREKAPQFRVKETLMDGDEGEEEISFWHVKNDFVFEGANAAKVLTLDKDGLVRFTEEFVLEMVKTRECCSTRASALVHALIKVLAADPKASASEISDLQRDLLRRCAKGLVPRLTWVH